MNLSAPLASFGPDGLNDLGAAMAAEGHLRQAERFLRQALELDPSSHTAQRNLGVVLLSLGRYREAAPYYETRSKPTPGLDCPEWRGEDLCGKRLLVWPEQGLGDQLMFSRFAPWLAKRGADVTLLCNARLERLFSGSLDVRVIAASGAVSFPDPDYWTPSNSLVSWCGVEPDTLPNAPYLSAPARSGLGRIGIAWRGNPKHPLDAERSLSAELGAELLSLPDAMSLHPEDTGAADFCETAEIVAGLDLVITVDTSIAHLAGAMGKPVWVLLPARATDWRWMRERADSPWYPAARLFRQTSRGDWRSVLDAVRSALESWE